MKRIKSALLAGTVFAVLAAQPLAAQQKTIAAKPVQVAATAIPENDDATVRNRTAAARLADGKQAPRQGAQALMVLGLALIVTPSVFRGAFSN